METKKTQPNQDLGKRTRAYAIGIIRLYSSLPKVVEVQIIAKQLLRAGTSVGAQYAEAKRAKSNRDFINELEGALQELEETLYWLDLLNETGAFKAGIIHPLQKETNELIAIFVTVVKKVKSK